MLIYCWTWPFLTCHYLSSACWDASHEHTVFLLTHTLILYSPCILYTCTLMSIPKAIHLLYVYTVHIHTNKYTVPFTPFLCISDSLSTPFYSNFNPLHEFLGLPCLPLLAVILPLFTYFSQSLSFCLSFLFSGFLLPLDPVLLLDSNTVIVDSLSIQLL